MKWLCTLLTTAWMTFVCADVDQHVKPCPNKSDGPLHTMRNIDFIYLINLDQRPEKLKSSLEQLTPYGIYPYRFSAVNGWELTLEDINDFGLKFSPEMDGGFMGTSYHLNGNFESSHEVIENYGQTYFCHCMARGTMGCWLSHFSVLQDAYDSGYETIWIMEDDIEVRRDPRLLSILIEELDEQVGKGNWDVLFTDRDIRGGNGDYVTAYSAARRPDFISSNDFAMKKDISAEFRQVGARYGSHSMIIRRSGIKKLVQFMAAHQVFFPYDLEYTLPQGIKIYTVLEDVVSNLPRAISDNGNANYLNKNGN